MASRSWLEVDEDLPLHHAVEIRHKSFANPEYVSLLRENNIALVVADTVKLPVMMDVTADIVYCRLHGSEKLYPNGYTPDAIDVWARRVIAWSRGEEVTDGTRIHPDPGPQRDSRDVFVYFDDDVKVRAPFRRDEPEQADCRVAEVVVKYRAARMSRGVRRCGRP